MKQDDDTLNFTPEVQAEIAAFIKEKTGAKSFILGVCTATMPCEESKHIPVGQGCGTNHLVDVMACEVAPEAWDQFTYGMYQGLVHAHHARTAQVTSPYEPSTT